MSMSAVEAQAPGWAVELPDEGATDALGALIAEELRRGDLVALSGELGAGKTALARAVVRALAGDPNLEVPSPTFTILQTYDAPAGPVVHADFYRLAGPDELPEIGFAEAADAGIALVEWPERVAAALPASRLEVRLTGAD